MPFSRSQLPPQSTRLRPGTLPVAIFYEDIASAERALRSLREILRQRNDPREIQPMLWQVGLLEHAHWIRLATVDAAHAELCLLSLGRHGSVSHEVATWFRELSPLNPGRWITLSPFEALGDHELAELSA